MSASELLESVVARIEALDPRLNAVVVRDFDRAKDAAKAADAALARGEDRPLLGIPVTLKEPFNVVGLPTTWGFQKFKDFVPTEDALAVSRLRQAGAVIIGKTNIPTGLREFQSYNDIYGTTNNPWDLGRSRRILGRVGRGARGRFRPAFDRIGYRGIDTCAGAFLWSLRAQANPRPDSASRIQPAACAAGARPGRSCGGRSDDAIRLRPCSFA
jgi:hypothetical protein